MTARLVIGAARSGEGKTSLVLGIARALADRGMSVAVAKVGPDYLDTGWHSLVASGPARNLDVWTMGEQGVRAAFARAADCADIVLVEGVMGLFDGHRSGVVPTSTADVAKLLGAPVVLVVDASRAGATLAATAHGLATYDPGINVAGAILNRFSASRDRAAVRDAFGRVGMPVLGWVPSDEQAVLDSRHLGLVQSGEDLARAKRSIEALGSLVAAHVDLDALVELARAAGPLPETIRSAVPAPAEEGRPRIAIARDEAFSFYYADGLEALRDLGADLVDFSPLSDGALPDVDGVYLGGGYPELHARALAENQSMLASVREAAGAGMPVYAECGGMLYLIESLADADGADHRLAGVLAARAQMGTRLQRVGYVEAELATPGALGDPGTVVRAHEFRYSSCEPPSGEAPAWFVEGEPRGFVSGPARNVVASYLHLNFAGCPDVAAAFVSACRTFSSERRATLTAPRDPGGTT